MAKKIHLALVHPKSGPTTFTGAAVPYKPPIDKIVAYYLLLAHNDLPFDSVVYWTRNECSEKQFAKWRDERICPIDIGDRKYHEAGVGSATEFVVTQFDIQLSPAQNRLVEMLNKNNATGNLKQGGWDAIAFLLRELYELTDDQQFHFKVMDKAAHVVMCFTQVEDGQIAQPLDGLEEALPDLVERFKKTVHMPLTLGRYVQDLWLLGNEPAQIREHVRFWTDGAAELQRKLAEGRKAFDELQPKDEFFAKGNKGIVVKSDDRFIAKAAIKCGDYMIRIIRTAAGHVTISTNGLDLGKVAEELTRREPGRWYYQAKMGALINGGPQYIGVQPTNLQPRHFIGMIQQYLTVPQRSLPQEPRRDNRHHGKRRDNRRDNRGGDRQQPQSETQVEAGATTPTETQVSQHPQNDKPQGESGERREGGKRGRRGGKHRHRDHRGEHRSEPKAIDPANPFAEAFAAAGVTVGPDTSGGVTQAALDRIDGAREEPEQGETPSE
jgi:hypothetical protein